MKDLAEQIPDVNLLLELQPEELAAKLLFVLRRRIERGERSVNLHNALNEVIGNFGNDSPYPIEKAQDVKIAISEAWLYLVAQGMIIPSPDGNGINGFSILSRRAKSFEDEAAFARHGVSRLLPKEILHERFADKVWAAFVRGEFDGAVFQATKSVEVYVREVGGFGNELLGVKLMQEAFKPDGGILTDANAEAGERLARMQLFCRAIGSYKNPNSHRDVNMEDPLEALEIILLANHLMKIVDARAAPI
ncbi:TIGR02391 family protein [Rhizobium laguerreae]|uniref:TIGR02391 family protein n=1 Tax=Rhizobium laguerreae TaxID=1076926 RepID=UPI001C91E76E|nr:TIGR02391 family protein [Rhizobium laguerreae]MBY3148822.1 TIGR02391 family protein [Rhizobium laguerreae]